jgi:phosphoribosylformylglycinamidine synthase
VVRPGDADAGVFAPVPGSPVGVAVSVDGVPAYGKISPYWAGAHAVAESMRNVACVGAAPRALSDCLNFGSPEDPEVFHGFEEALKGIGDAARRIWQVHGPEESAAEPVPIVTGNVSFYNQTAAGKAVAASPVVACYGVMRDFSKAVTMGLKQPGSLLLMAGLRRDELGGSLYYERLLGRVGRNVPVVRFDSERAAISLVLEAIERGLLEACHDVSSGGLAMTLAEMCMAGRGALGASVDVTAAAGAAGSRRSGANAGGVGAGNGSGAGGLRSDRKLFSETPGFVMEVPPGSLEELLWLAHERHVRLLRLGVVSSEPALRVRDRGAVVLDVAVKDLKERWARGLERALA